MTGGWRSLAVAVALVAVPVAATAVEWSAPRPVFHSTGHVRDQVVVDDSAGGTHLFFVETTSEPGVSRLVYMRRDQAGWSEPVYVFDPVVKVEFPAAAIDSRGWLHVVYAGPQWGQLEHRRVPLSLAADPTAWSRAQTLSDGGVLHSHLTATADDLHLVYASRKGDVFYEHSEDGGRTWSDAVAVSAVDRTHVASDLPHVVVDGRGRVHVVWTQFELPRGWPPIGAFYSRSIDGGQTWSSPREMAGLNRGLITVATRGDDDVHLAWNAVVAIGDRDHAWSADGGETWSAPEPLSTQIRGGWTGPPAIAFDSAGALHEVTSVDGPGRVERIVELTRTGTRWSEPELASGVTTAEKSVEWPTLALSGGNQLHVAYEVDYRQIWYTEGVADAPPVGPQPVPTVGTDLGSRLADSSLRFRLLLAVLAALVISAPIELAWRRVHWRAR
jgi:hypothetical protein